MCGIFGVINTNEKIDEGRVIAARDVLAHRGPDDAGLYLSCTNASTHASVALAHRRLSIIDLSPAAHQPMTTEDGNFTIVFNGEIYNYVELSQKSKVKSQKLRSNSDTEIILNLYAQYGKDCLQLLRGMFAFAIWDDQEKTLFAARDRFGIKPFYYLHDENPPDGEAGFIFSSELKAIKHYKGNLTINNDALDAFLRTGSVPAPLTIYNEAASLLPGNYLTINNSKCTINNYWKFEEMMVDGKWLMDDGKKVLDSRLSDGEAGLRGNDKQEERSGHTSMAVPLSMTRDQDQGSRTKYQPRKLKYDSEAKKKIRTALLDSVHAHMVSDVEVGAFLSGGIDSTAIVSLMRQCGQEKIKTVSVVFPGNKLDESKYARLAAKTYNTEHIEIPFYEKDLLDDFENIMAVMDQPTIDGINTYFVSKAAKQAGLKVVLSGLGGDELFGGYPSFNLIPKYQRIKNLPFAKMFMKFAAPLLKNKLPAKAIHYMKNPAEPNAEYKLVRGLFTESELQSLGWISAIQNSKLKIKNSLNDSSSAPGTMPSALRPPSTNNPMTMNDSISNGAMTNDYPHFEYAQCDKEAEGISGLVKVSYLESCFYMRNQLLRDSDVFSMAHSIELRVPFVDHLLYEAVLPYLDSVYDKNFPKKMLVEAVGDIPDEIVNRPKMGFTFPFEDWIRNGQLKDLMNLPKASLREKNKDLNNSLYIDHSTLYIEKLHWSRLWALFIMNRWKGNN